LDTGAISGKKLSRIWRSNQNAPDPGSATLSAKAEKPGLFFSFQAAFPKKLKEGIIEERRIASLVIYEEEKDTVELASYPGTVSRFLGSKRFPSKAIKDTPLKK
jgi:hypothetical protein